MARQQILDIKLLGDKQLETAFLQLPILMNKKIARKAVRGSAKGLRPKLAMATPVRTGKLRAAMAAAKVRSASNRRHVIRFGVLMPTREELGIPQDTLVKKYGYYPLILEYGTAHVSPMMWIRRTADRETLPERARMRRSMQRDVALEFNRRTWHG